MNDFFPFLPGALVEVWSRVDDDFGALYFSGARRFDGIALIIKGPSMLGQDWYYTLYRGQIRLTAGSVLFRCENGRFS